MSQRVSEYPDCRRICHYHWTNSSRFSFLASSLPFCLVLQMSAGGRYSYRMAVLRVVKDRADAVVRAYLRETTLAHTTRARPTRRALGATTAPSKIRGGVGLTLNLVRELAV